MDIFTSSIYRSGEQNERAVLCKDKDKLEFKFPFFQTLVWVHKKEEFM